MKSVWFNAAASGLIMAMAAGSAPAMADDHVADHAAAPAPAQHSCDAIVPGWQVPALADPATASPQAIGCAVAAWQLAANNDLSYVGERIGGTSYDRGWVKATFYIGLDYFAERLGDRQMLTRVEQYAYDNGMELGERYWHGDDQAVAAVYGAMALRHDRPELMNKSIKVFDQVIDDNYTVSLEFSKETKSGVEDPCQKRWCWADAIFMAPPAWALASRISGDPKYVDYAASETREVIAYLQDPASGLLFRDSRYFDLKTENDKPVFWSRGNGWVIAGLARFIDAMPADHPELPLMKQTYLTLADKLVEIQREDGYWPTSLLDPELLLNPETSGTAFFGYGLAWGLNNGMLEGAKYEIARDKAWDAMRRATTSAGKVGWVQQIGKDPQSTEAETSQLYAAGGMLLFATEMLSKETPE